MLLAGGVIKRVGFGAVIYEPTHSEGVTMNRIPKIITVLAAVGIMLAGGAGTAAAQDPDNLLGSLLDDNPLKLGNENASLEDLL